MTARREPIRVLVVDEDALFVALARDWLASEPGLAFVGWAPDGEEALEAVASLKPNVVLVGGVLPGHEGFETARRIKALPGAPLVVVTSFADSDSVRHEAWISGADAFVAKTDLTEQLPSLLAAASSVPDRAAPSLPSRFQAPADKARD